MPKLKPISEYKEDETINLYYYDGSLEETNREQAKKQPCCEDWEINSKKIDDLYDGKQFIHCPWCGKKIEK